MSILRNANNFGEMRANVSDAVAKACSGPGSDGFFQVSGVDKLTDALSSTEAKPYDTLWTLKEVERAKAPEKQSNWAKEAASEGNAIRELSEHLVEWRKGKARMHMQACSLCDEAWNVLNGLRASSNNSGAPLNNVGQLTKVGKDILPHVQVMSDTDASELETLEKAYLEICRLVREYEKEQWPKEDRERAKKKQPKKERSSQVCALEVEWGKYATSHAAEVTARTTYEETLRGATNERDKAKKEKNKAEKESTAAETKMSEAKTHLDTCVTEHENKNSTLEKAAKKLKDAEANGDDTDEMRKAVDEAAKAERTARNSMNKARGVHERHQDAYNSACDDVSKWDASYQAWNNAIEAVQNKGGPQHEPPKWKGWYSQNDMCTYLTREVESSDLKN